MGEESAKFVLAIIAIVLLIFLLIKLVSILRQKTQYEQAKESLKEIENLINSLNEGQTGYILLEGPKNWLLWRDEKEQNKVCICPSISLSFWGRTFAFTNNNNLVEEKCRKEGVCMQINKPLMINMKCYANVMNCFIFDRVPFLLEFTKNKGGLLINNAQITHAQKIFSMIISDRNNFEEIEKGIFSWSWNKNGIENMVNKQIGIYERKNNLKVEKWYLFISVIRFGSERLSYSKFGSDLTLLEGVCLNKILFEIKEIMFRPVINFYYEKEKIDKSPAEYCLGGEWFSFYAKVKNEDGKERDVLFQFRVDVKEN